jgi:hypothetical protein
VATLATRAGATSEAVVEHADALNRSQAELEGTTTSNRQAVQPTPPLALLLAEGRSRPGGSRASDTNEAFLLTGSGESGKSTIVKQMKIIHQNGYTHEELMTFRTTIYKNTLESAHHILLAMRKIGVDFVNPQNSVHANVSLSGWMLTESAYRLTLIEYWTTKFRHHHPTTSRRR